MSLNEPNGTYEGMPEASARKPAWFALQVKSNRERIVADTVRWKGYDEFVPTYRARRRWSDRFRDIDLPLFPGYVFSRFDVYDRLPLLIIPGVVQVVGRGRVPVPVEDEEMEAVRRLVSSGLPLQPWPFLGVGHEVHIEEGPLRSLKGTVVAMKGCLQLVVSVTLLQRSVAVAMDRSWVRPESRSGAPVGVLPQYRPM